MAFGGGSKTESSLSEINVTPLVDVMLVLLIIFMITAPMMERGTDVSVPKTKHGTAIPEERLIITINSKNEITLSGRKDQVGIDLLPDEIKSYFETHHVADDSRTIYVRADKDVPYENLMLVIDQAKEAGVNSVGLVTDPKGTTDEGKSDGKKGK